MSEGPFERGLVAVVRGILRRPGWGLFALLLFVGLLTAPVVKLGFDNSVEAFFREGDPTLEAYAEFRREFVSDESVVVMVEAPETWTVSFIDLVDRLTAELERIPHVVEVTSIVNVPRVEARDDELEVVPFIGSADRTAQGLATRRKSAIAHPTYGGYFISADGRHLGIWAQTEIIEHDLDYKVQLTQDIRQLIAKPEYAVLRPHAVGPPMIDSDIRVISARESGMFGAITAVLVGLGFAAVYRSLLIAMIPLLITGLSLACTFGVLGAIGGSANVLTPIIPSFMISVGSGTATYLLTELLQQQRAHSELAVSTELAFRKSGAASAVATLTTAGGLLAFSSSDVRPVQEVGVGLGIGLLISFVITVVVIPLCVSQLKALRPSARRDEILYGRVEILHRVARFTIVRWRSILGVSALVGLAAMAGAAQLRADYHYQAAFKRSTAARQAYDAVDSALSGSTTIEVVVKSDLPKGVTTPGLLQKVDAFQRGLEARYADMGLKTYSLVDVVKDMYQSLSAKHEHRVPDDQGVVSECLFVFESSAGGQLRKMVSTDYSRMRLVIASKSLADSRYEPVYEDVRRFERELQAAVGGHTTLTLTGTRYVWSQIDRYLTHSQIISLLICSLVVSVALVLAFRSLFLGLVMTAVNAFAILISLGVMGWSGITLDPYTILIGSMALGILDDDTIHNVKCVLASLREGKTLPEAITDAHESAGQAMFYTAATMTVAFSCLVFSDMASLTRFGLIVALTIVVGAICEFFLMPAVLIGLDALGMKLAVPEAPSPQTSVPQPAVRRG